MKNDIGLILKAASFAAEKHRGQLRKDVEATPYINHPLEVARILAEEGAISDPEVIAAALLHDTIEDTETSESELAALFGVRVASIVAEVTDDKSITDKAERKRLQIVNAPNKSPGAALVKLADKTANVRDVGSNPAKGWSEERRLAYLDWAEIVVNALPLRKHPLTSAFQQSLESSRALIGRPKRFTSIRVATDEDYRRASGYSVGALYRAPMAVGGEGWSTRSEQSPALDLQTLPFDPAEAAGKYSAPVKQNQGDSWATPRTLTRKGELLE